MFTATVESDDRSFVRVTRLWNFYTAAVDTIASCEGNIFINKTYFRWGCAQADPSIMH